MLLSFQRKLERSRIIDLGGFKRGKDGIICIDRMHTQHLPLGLYLDGLNVSRLLFVSQEFPLRATQRKRESKDRDSLLIY